MREDVSYATDDLISNKAAISLFHLLYALSCFDSFCCSSAIFCATFQYSNKNRCKHVLAEPVRPSFSLIMIIFIMKYKTKNKKKNNNPGYEMCTVARQ